MEWFNSLDVIAVAAVSLGLIMLMQWTLYRLGMKLQKRELVKLTGQIENRLKASDESQWGAVQARIKCLCEEQQAALDELRTNLAERELRTRTASARIEPVSANRLDRRHQVLALAQMGFDSRDIARKLRLSRGETELMLGLCTTLSETGKSNG